MNSIFWSMARTGEGLAAKVNRVLLSGATARVELTGIVGSNGHAQPQRFEVELTRDQLADLRPGAWSVGATDVVASEDFPAGTLTVASQTGAVRPRQASTCRPAAMKQ